MPLVYRSDLVISNALRKPQESSYTCKRFRAEGQDYRMLSSGKRNAVRVEDCAGTADPFLSEDLNLLLNNGKEKRKKVRGRRACTECNRLHIKCDNQRPCNHCVEKKKESRCRSDKDRLSCLGCRKAKYKCDRQTPCMPATAPVTIE